jgi:hypothetical protein
MQYLLAMSVITTATLVAQAQYMPGNPWGWGGGGFGFAGTPGLYGGGLSPYLNLRGGLGQNRAINYFNFARPYLGGTFGNAMVAPYAPIHAVPGGGSGGRFFPVQAPFWDVDSVQPQQAVANATPDDNGLIPTKMPPAGHGGGFNNTMGYFGVGSAMSGGRPGAMLGRPRPR